MDGLAASVGATINDRVGRTAAATHEIKAIPDDYRMQAVGGMMGAWDLWNLAVVSSLINNCSTGIGDHAGKVHQDDAGGTSINTKGCFESRDRAALNEA